MRNTASAVSLDPGAGLTEHIIELPDARRIRTVMAGQGLGPLVVFEAGMSAPASEWLVVQRAVSAHARTLAYDRSGYGGSDHDSHDRTVKRMAEDLAAVLTAAGEEGPLILVAHSWGGPIIRAFLHDNPDRAAGIVLVDISLVASTVTKKQVVLGKASFRLSSLLVRMRLTSAVVRMALPHGLASEFSDDDVAIVTRDYASVRAMRTGVREVDKVLDAREALEAWEQQGLPDVPVVALQGGRVEKGQAARRFRETFNQQAQDSLAEHPRARVVTVEGAGHLIPQEQPGAVVDAILEVIAARA